VLKLIDFGLVAEAGTQEKDFAGSIHYAAPEQILGEPVTGSADLYAVGGVLYEMLSGRMPYDAPTATEVGRAKVKHKPKPLAKLAPWVPEPVARLVLQALEREPEKRPPSAKAFREALDAAVGYRAPNEAVRGRAAIPAVTKVRVPPPGGKGRTAPMPSGAGSASFSDDTLLKAGLPSRPVRLGELWLEIVAGLVVGLVMLGLVHAMVSP
jgi:serine/threonine protein kinase